MSKSGFALLEVLIAVVLFTTGVVAVSGLFGSGLIGSSDAEHTEIAMNLAQGKIEEIRNLVFDDIVDEAKADVGGFLGFQREVEVSAPAFDPDMSDIKDVTVTAYWTHRGDEISVPVQTYISMN